MSNTNEINARDRVELSHYGLLRDIFFFNEAHHLTCLLKISASEYCTFEHMSPQCKTLKGSI